MNREPDAERGSLAVPTSSVLDTLSRVHETALQEHILSKKVKELIALATSVATACETSIAYHLHNALEAGATPQEVMASVEVAVVTAGEPAAVHGARILRAFAPYDADDAEAMSDSQHQTMYRRAATHPYMAPD